MRKTLLALTLFLLAGFFIGSFPAYAQGTNSNPAAITPPLCQDTGSGAGCPGGLGTIYEQLGGSEKCVHTYEEFKKNPTKNHLWVEDEDVIAQGQASERARQFISWIMSHSAIDNHPVLFQIWGTTRNMAFFFTILSAALFGLAIIVGQRTSFATDVKIWPSITKILMGLFYISFSATIVVLVIQLSEIVMKFFIENLGGNELFNIYFSGGVSQEKNYIDVIGCRDLNLRVQEAARTELWILKATSFSYYLMGGALLVRKIILWFLLFASPFLAILMFFNSLKNVGWTWVRVFFQWVFYGPLLALFLGSMATIWKAGIPFLFDFSRVNTAAGYVYPTAITILYGGPGQQIGSPTNNGNYVDTFVQYIISLIMLWTVTIFPWFLLRTFADFCCDGINAIKNMMLANLNNLRGGQPAPSPVMPSQSTSFGAAREMVSQMTRKIETTEEIKKARTEEIVQSLSLHAGNLTQIANLETNTTTNKMVNKNINYLKNPSQAESANDRLRYMNLRSELATRAATADPMARQVLNSFMYPRPQALEQKQLIMKTLPRANAVTHIISVKVKIPKEKSEAISTSMFNYGAANHDLTNAIAGKTALIPEKVSEVLSLLSQNLGEPAPQIAEKIAHQTKIERAKVVNVIKEFSDAVANTKVAEEIAAKQNLAVDEVKKVAAAQKPALTETEKNIEDVAPVSPQVTIDEYEQVKKMWIEHYEKGEIPPAENIKTRMAWVDQDIVLITNTLNKLLSDDKTLQEQALDEVGFILPIFLVNNLSGEQLVTYLKAKIEAAKEVKGLGLKEREIADRLKAESEKVEVDRPKRKEAAKTMEMKREIKQ